MERSNPDNALVLKNKLEINKLSSDFPEPFKQVFRDVESRRNDMLRQISAQMPNVVNVVQTANAADTYRVVNNVVLTPGDDGLYSAVVRDGQGRITEHVKLEKSTSDFARAAAFSFSVLNVAVGQANMMSIAERLAEIESQLDEAKYREYIDRISEVESACRGLNEALCLKDDDHIRQTIIDHRTKLRAELGKLYGYIDLEIKNMPMYHKRTWKDVLFSNWGPKESTNQAKADKRFECIMNALPIWCKGMSFLALTEPYIKDSGFNCGREFAGELRKIIIDNKLSRRVVYVSMRGGFDPIDAVKKLENRIPEMERYFSDSFVGGERMVLEIRAD